MIRTLIFDLGRVLVPFDFERGHAAIGRLCGLTVPAVRARIGSTDLVHRFECGLIEARDFVRDVTEVLDVNLSYEQFCEIWSCIFLPHTLVPDSLLAALHRRYRMLLLSNTNAIHFEMIQPRYAFWPHFDELVLSYKVKALKPDPRIYAAALSAAGCRPEECFFTDDIPAYVEGARKAGIDATVFEDSAQLERELSARGITWG